MEGAEDVDVDVAEVVNCVMPDFLCRISFSSGNSCAKGEKLLTKATSKAFVFRMIVSVRDEVM